MARSPFMKSGFRELEFRSEHLIFRHFFLFNIECTSLMIKNYILVF